MLVACVLLTLNSSVVIALDSSLSHFLLTFQPYKPVFLALDRFAFERIPVPKMTHRYFSTGLFQLIKILPLLPSPLPRAGIPTSVLVQPRQVSILTGLNGFSQSVFPTYMLTLHIRYCYFKQ